MVWVGVLAVVLAFALSTPPHLDAATGTPSVDQPIVATYRADSITLTGSGFGSPSQSRAILFDFGSQTASVVAGSGLVDIWEPNRIELDIPWEVKTGELRVVVDGKASTPVELRVYEYEAFDIPISAGTNDRPLAVTVADDGTAWLNQEFHRELKAIAPSGEYQALGIPQASGPGIFASTTHGVLQTKTSVTGEDIHVDGQGRIWFSQGGASLYNGTLLNTSRIVRYDPDSADFACFNVPTDNATVMGVLVDHARNTLWYSEGNFFEGNAISALSLDSTLSNCHFDPHAGEERDEFCEGSLTSTCHLRFPLPNPNSVPAHLTLDGEGNVWFTEFWGNRIGMLRPEAGEVVEYPLPSAIAQSNAGQAVGSGPWELAFDSEGDLWINEFFDATVARLDTSLIEGGACDQLVQGENPCVEDVLVASDGSDYKTIHSLSIGSDELIWFAVTDTASNYSSASGSRLGFVSPSDAYSVVFLPQREDSKWFTGIAHDQWTGDIWVAGFDEHELSRLTLTEGATDGGQCASDPDLCDGVDTDGDGCTDAEEMGPDAQFGGRRDPANFWDFYDTPNAAGVRDGSIDLPNDILSVVLRLLSSDANGTANLNRYSDPMAPLPADPKAYHPAFDRTPAAAGRPAWETGPPDGQITLLDVVAVIMQYGHKCFSSAS